MPEFKIGERKVGSGHPCFIVAEISSNHQQDYEQAVGIVKAAAAAGADAIKMQTYTAETITLDSRKDWFIVGGKDNPESWQKETFFDLYKKAYCPWEWQPKLKKLSEELGMMFFSTPFDDTAVDFLESMDVPCYKIASYEATDIPLLKRVAKTGKPVIMSVGFASLEEIDFSVSVLREHGAKDISLLHCVSMYSEMPDVGDMNLRTISDLRERYGVVSGFSDNNFGTDVPVLAVAAGASIIEKHFTTNRDNGSFDARFSLNAGDWKKMVDEIRKVEKILGEVHYGPANQAEAYNRRFRRSLFVARDMKKGELFTKENVRDIRPADGLETRYFDEILGKAASQDVEAGTPLSWPLIQGKKSHD